MDNHSFSRINPTPALKHICIWSRNKWATIKKLHNQQIKCDLGQSVQYLCSCAVYLRSSANKKSQVRASLVRDQRPVLRSKLNPGKLLCYLASQSLKTAISLSCHMPIAINSVSQTIFSQCSHECVQIKEAVFTGYDQLQTWTRLTGSIAVYFANKE